jgi:DNA-binding NarL/FixJ family response regulator
MARAVAGDVPGMRTHLERAVELATAQGRQAARCEALARLAVESARLGSETGDAELLAFAEGVAEQAKALVAILPGRPQWGPECDAALASVHRARGDMEAAVRAAAAAVLALQEGQHEDVHPDVLIPAGTVLLEAGPPETQEFVRSYLQVAVARIVQGTLDESVRIRWLRSPNGSRLVSLADAPGAGIAEGRPSGESALGGRLGEHDRDLLLLVTEGLTNREMAERLGITESAVTTRLAAVMAAMGASDRAQATTLAMRGLGAGLPAGSGGQGLTSA